MWQILAVFFSVILIYLIAYKPYQYWKGKKVPYAKPIPVFGNGFNLFFRRLTMHEWVQQLYKQGNERVLGIYSLFTPVLMIRDLNLIKLLGVKEFDHFMDHKSFLSEEADPLFGGNLFSLEGERWRTMRSTLSPAFTSSKMKAMFNLISDCSSKYTDYLLNIVDSEKPFEIEMKDTFSRFANDIIATTAFGIECNSIRDKENEFYLMGKDATNFGGWRTFKMLGFTICPKLMQLLKVQIFSSQVSNFFRNLIKSTLRTREEGKIIRPDMIHLLMEARKGKLKYDANILKDEDAGFATVEESDVGKNGQQNKIELTDDLITAQALLFFLAGFETISTAMCLMAHELAVHEDIQLRLQEEIDETLQQCNGKITYEVVLKMKYLDMVLCETLRKWPPVAALDRNCVESFTIPPENPNDIPIKVNKDDMIWLPVYAIHRDPQYYDDPDKFDPERFSDENKKKIHPMAYLPFGVGPRNCIGSRFALLEAKTIYLHLLSKFSLVLIKKSEVPIQFVKGEFNITAKNGIWLGLKKRNVNKLS